MLRLTIISVFSFLLFTGYSQSFEWVVTAGGNKSDKGSEIVVDHEGNIFETGYYNEQGFFGPFDTGFSFASSKEVYVAKMDPDGNYLWVKNGLNYYDDRGLGLCVDPQGNVYVSGTCWGGLEWGTLNVYNSSSYTDQIFVVKMDTDGNEIWMKNAGVNEASYPYNDDHGQDLACDSQGNIIVTGFLSNNEGIDRLATFDAITVNVSANDSVAFVAKLSNDGNWQWVQTFDGIYAHRDNACAVDDEDNIYITGSFFKDNSVFGTQTLNSFGAQDIYVVKYDTDGNFLWVTQAGSDKGDRGNDIVYGGDGCMYITGEFKSTCNFNSNISLNNYGSGAGDKDIFVAKITKSGNWVWATKAGSKKDLDKGISIASNGAGNIYVTGQFYKNAKFGDFEIDTGTDSVDVFIAGIDTLGFWRWAMKGGGPIFDRGTGIAVDDNCNIYTTGWFTNTIAFGAMNGTAVLAKEIFTIKISDVCFDYSTPPPPPPPPGSLPGAYAGFHLPNAFSPNADEKNDLLQYYVGYDVEAFDLKIFDRWGNMVFRTQTDGDFWDGMYKGELVNSGVYTYTLDLMMTDTGKSVKTGNITVIR